MDPEGNQKLNRTGANYTDMDYGVSEDPKVTKCFHNLNEDVIKGANVKQPENLCLLTKEETRSNQNYPRHIPVHVLESNSETCTQCSEHDMTCPSSIIHQAERPFSKVNNFANPTASATTECHSSISIQQSLSSFPSLLNPFSNRDSYSMFVNPTFSNLIVSTLLQNPAAHAAASFAASFWPFSNMETPVDSPLCSFEGFQSRHGDLSPSTSAIAVATVMAASAWWAANGILPMRPLPLHTGLNFAPIIPSQTDTIEKEKSDHRILFSPCEGQQLDPGLSKALESKVPDTKLPPLSLSDCNKSGNTRSSNAEVEAASHKQKSLSLAALQEADKGKSKEQVDRSSCGSNTPSSSEVEMDLLEKHTNGKDEFNDQIINNWTSEPNNHRNRSAGNMNEFWREVSEEGKIAFKALFSREVLPQSFTPLKCLGNHGQLIKSNEDGLHKSDEKGEDKLQPYLNSKTFLIQLDCRERDKQESLSEGSSDKGLLSMEYGHGKVRARRAGFKPYKRYCGQGEQGGE
ncbi:hypothetical protein AQUCO_01300001v1 [Aquilegia coerulea]|uniref:Uncharacterized protein n=1 Tax=Aquilegia coerulea TaxID=218851 RepID=A0A2G5DZ37_AQUCA|nr:hypothetical protein AQUCO_01300001v1 [Aquilegia coerulea]